MPEARFDLRIIFGGACLFVPEDRKSDSKPVHVLLPHEDGTHEHQGDAPKKVRVERHLPLLMWDGAHESQNGSQPQGDIWSSKRDWRFRHLYRKLLQLPAGQQLSGGATIDAEIDPVVAHVTKLHPGSEIDPTCFGGTSKPTHHLAARITLQGGSAEQYGPGVCWELPQKEPERELTSTVHWVVKGVTQTSINALRLQFLDAGAFGEPLPDLYPIRYTLDDSTEADEVRLWVVNVPENQVPSWPNNQPKAPAPKKDFHAMHFLAFYDLFETKPGKGNARVPVRRGVKWPTSPGGCGGATSTTGPTASGVRLLSITAETCMTGQG